MNKLIFVISILFGSSAFAAIPVPPKRPACFTQAPVCVAEKPTVPAPIFIADPNMYGATVVNGEVIIREQHIHVKSKQPWWKFW